MITIFDPHPELWECFPLDQHPFSVKDKKKRRLLKLGQKFDDDQAEPIFDESEIK